MLQIASINFEGAVFGLIKCIKRNRL